MVDYVLDELELYKQELERGSGIRVCRPHPLPSSRAC